jgi:hypothetical protein
MFFILKAMFSRRLQTTMTSFRTAFALPLPLLLLYLLVPPTASAQQEAGDTELQFSGSAQTTTESSTTTVITNAKVGQYFTRSLQIGVTTSLTAFFPENGDAEYGGRGGAFFNYSFLSGDATTVPYLGGQYSRSLERTFEEDQGNAGINGGFKFYLNRRTALDVGGNYLFPLEETGSGVVLFQFGISFIL